MLKPTRDHDIPEMTRLVAHHAFPTPSLAMVVRDELGPIFDDEEFAALYPKLGQPAASPARLALVTVLQFVENLSDRQAATAVRGRIDWKYALGLELSDPGFHYSVLSEFRQRLVAGGEARRLLESLLARCKAKGHLKGKHVQRSDSTHVLAAVRHLSLLELVGETMRRTLEALARAAPNWLQRHWQAPWLERYGRAFEVARLPRTREAQHALAVTIGEDGRALLAGALAPEAPPEVRHLPLVEVMRRIWLQQFYDTEEQIHWRTKKEWGLPTASQMLVALDDLEARFRIKRQTEWIGYQVHLTETCARDQPHLITQVETTIASRHDSKVTATIHDDLAARDLLPSTHLVDEGYTEADLLVSSQARGVDLVGPLPSRRSWQDRTEGAYTQDCFQFDWEQRVATCPQGKQSRSCHDRRTWRDTPSLTFTFSARDCRPCAERARCTRAKNCGRHLTVYPRVEYEARQAARARQEAAAFKRLYRVRAVSRG